ncbi:MAG: hypothetical protein WC601_00385 [Desulfotomaculaceae bacterium]
MDWTDKYDQPAIVEKTNKFIDQVIDRLHQSKIEVFSGLTRDELALVIRFPVHVATNIFVERLLRQYLNREIYPPATKENKYYNNTVEAVQSYYYDFSVNYTLLNQIASVFGAEERAKDVIMPITVKIDQSSFILLKLRNVKKYLLGLRSNIFMKLMKPVYICDYSNWMRMFMPASHIFAFDFNPRVKEVDRITRRQIRAVLTELFLIEIDGILSGLHDQEKQFLALIYAEFAEHILPTSLVEGLRPRFSYYRVLLKDWPVRQLHSFTGFQYNDNLKIFAVLAKREKAILVGYEHGITNFIVDHRGFSNELVFLDYFFSWGVKNSDWLAKGAPLANLKIFNFGSPYLGEIKKWERKAVSPPVFTILYPSGPLLDFMDDLEGASPEKNRQHRLKVLMMLRAVLKLFPSAQILYKPFPGTFAKDPIKDVLAEELGRGLVKIVYDKPIHYFNQVDLVLWDTISTGFAESMAAGVPTMVFHSNGEKQQALPLGKMVDGELEKAGIVFYDIESGLNAFKRIINDRSAISRSESNAVKVFQEALAYPVKRTEFVGQVEKALNIRMQG